MLNYLKRKVDQFYFNKKGPQAFSNLYNFSSKSQAYLKFCQELHGLSFPVQNNVSQAQLENLLTKIEQVPHAQILDLGCGQGNLSHYIGEKFNCRVLGVDFAPISNEHIEKQQGNYEKIKYDRDRFDIILAIDAFYMINNMKVLLKNLFKSLKSDGRLFTFYTSPGPIEECKIYVCAKSLKLNINLEKLEDDFDFWQKSKNLLENMEEEFFSEGTGTLWKMKYNEVLQNLRLYEQQSPTRYLITLSRK